MELRSNLKSFKIFSIIIFSIVTIMGLYTGIGFVFLGYIGNIGFWLISVIESNDFLLDEEKITIRNRLRLEQLTNQIFYRDIEHVKAINLKHTRHPYQRIEFRLKSGKLLKYSCTGLKEDDFKTMTIKLENHVSEAVYESD